MTLTIELPTHVEEKLRERAAAAGRDAAQYIVHIVEEAMSHPTHPLIDVADDAEQNRLHAIADRLLAHAEEVIPDTNPPRLTGRKAEFEQAVVEKFQRQGLGK